MAKFKYSLSEFYDKAHRNVNKRYWPYQRLTRTHSIFFSYFFASIGISPNTITILMLIPALVGSILFTSINLFSDIAALLCFHFVLILDQADGEIARAMDKTSKYGVFLDRVMHMVNHPIIYLSISYHFYILEDNIHIFALGFLYICSDFIKNDIVSVYRDVMSSGEFSKFKDSSSKSEFTNISLFKTPIQYLSGIYSRHFYHVENGWFFLIIIYPFDYYLKYQIFDLHLTSFTICLFFILQIIYSLKKLVVISIPK